MNEGCFLSHSSFLNNFCSTIFPPFCKLTEAHDVTVTNLASKTSLKKYLFKQANITLEDTAYFAQEHKK